ncbi:MAG: pyruvate dehydrogenase (acetyl-transferring) E1 component subunit alpha [Dehalococcoidia bacterium]|nr:pyruvate dehydrogenase (acetyl-transferring) E1 component subunit alpha [Dehalococcoidia bacterium]
MAMTRDEMGVDKATALGLYDVMVRIRSFEEKCAEMYGKAKIGGFLHLYIGEEAVAAGVIPLLEAQDTIVSHYREHGHAIARGLDSKRMMAELFGRATGTSKGKGGSMHIFDASKGFLGGYAIVGGMMPVATGLGLASNYLGTKSVCLCIFGDGAVNQGEFHESFNLASLWKLPVVFLLENNGFGMGTRVERVHAGKEMSHLGDAFQIPSEQVDGMDVLAVREVAARAIEHARSGKGPFFLEAVCYRFRGHSMADAMSYRDKAEEEVWRRRDPLPNFRRLLAERRAATEQELAAVEERAEREMADAAAFADASPNPPREAMYEHIYKE